MNRNTEEITQRSTYESVSQYGYADAVLCTALDVGEGLLRSGAEITRVEDTITRICKHYGAVHVEVFSITTLIIASIRMDDGGQSSQNRHVPTSSNNLHRLQTYNAISREICMGNLSIEEAQKKLHSAKRSVPYGNWAVYLGAVLASGGFAVFFGGSWFDFIPAALIGIVGDKILEKVSGRDIDGWIYNWQTVAAALIIYGILFIVIERVHKNKTCSVNSTDELSFKQAAVVGCFQALSIVPGTSRSGSTILGSRTIGISRSAAAEFSFFMGIPAMAGGSLIKGLGFVDYVMDTGISVPATAYICLAVASVVAFAVSMIAIKFLMEFVKKHSFAPFGVYRIVLGALVILYFALVR